ncbi:MAG: hypothetical protein IPG04_25160 [Polyangiaceae bacterium]|nr:hypothetical protein [Polyangiaceae bacterium]
MKLASPFVFVAVMSLGGCGPASGGGEASSSSAPTARAQTSTPATGSAASSGSVAASAAASAAPTSNIPAVACTAQGDKPALLADLDGTPRDAALDPARLFWIETTFLDKKESRLRSVAKDGSDAKLLATWPGGVADALAVEGDTVYVTVEHTLSAVPREGGTPRKLENEIFGTLAVRAGVIYTFRHDPGVKQDQLIAIAAASGTTVLATWPRTREFPDVWSFAVDEDGKLLVVEPDGVARLDPATKAKQSVPFTKKGQPAKLYAISNRPALRGQLVAFGGKGVAPLSGGELTGPALELPIAFFGHSVVGVESTHDDIGGAFPASVVQASTTSDKKRSLRKMAGFQGAITGDDACVYVLNAVRGQKAKVEAYAISPL